MKNLFLKRTFGFIFTSIFGLIFVIFISTYFLSKIGNLKLPEKVSYLIVGNSRPECAFDDSIIEGSKNACNSGESYFYNYTKLKKLLVDNSNVKTVFIEFSYADISKRNDEWIWGFEKMSNFFPNYSPFFDFGDYRFLYKKNPDDFLSIISIATRKNLGRLFTLQYSFLNVIGKYKSLDETVNETLETIENDDKIIHQESDNQLSLDNLEYLRKILEFCKSKKIKVFLIRVPVHSSSIDSVQEEIFLSVKKEKFDDVEFLDLSQFPLKNQDFADKTHLNKYGAKKISSWFNSMIQNKMLEKLDKEAVIRTEFYNLLNQ